ncbi:MAG: OmpA family protein [Mangrovibacterium sp.]
MNTHAQNKKAQKYFDEALKSYRSNNYFPALILLDRAADCDKEFKDIYLLKSEIYLELDSIPQQVESLKKSIELGEESTKIKYLLTEAQYKMGDYENSLNGLSQIAPESIDDKFRNKISRLQQQNEIAIELVRHAVEFNPERLSSNVNSTFNEYWPCVSINDSLLTFTRLMTNERIPQEDFYQSMKTDDSGWGKATPLRELNTSQNEGAQSISADDELFFFAACNREDGYGSCDIYYSRRLNGSWSSPNNAGAIINSKAWESQPSIAADGTYLYFSSNRTGGKGKKDIWRCELNGFDNQGKLLCGKLENLGDSINTAGDEISPFIHPDGESLYFSSDTWDGLGKHDIFLARWKTDFTWSKAQNIGYPINSYRNEQGFVVSANGKTAYYASDIDRKTGHDIYSFNLPETVRPTPVIPNFGKLEKLAVGNSIVLQHIFFNYNSFELLPESHNELDKLVSLFSEFPKLQIEIGGHTDNQGSQEYNLKLSSQRAEAVYNYLVESGIDKKLLSFKGYGAIMPIESNDTEEGRAQNRRTEFKIIAF